MVLGDLSAVRRALAADAAAATRPGGSRKWVPLLFLCFGRVMGPRTAGDAVEVARLLLAAGADPNSDVLFHDRYRWSAIVGEGESGPIAAPAHPQARALVELLFDAGADPNDSQALYDTHFQRDNRRLELFLSRGLGPRDGADWTAERPTETLAYLLGQAVNQGFADRVALLLAHGAPPSGRDFYRNRPHLENALLAGHTEIAALLVRHGAAPPALSPAEALCADLLRADEAAVRARLSHPIDGRDDVGTLLAAAEHGRLRAVRLLLDMGVPVDATNADGVTALHLAASNGHRLVVDELLARGAPLDIRDRVHDGSPLERVTWFPRNWPTPERDEMRCALAARATDVHDVVHAGAVERLAALLAADPARARARRPNGRTPLHVLADREIPDWEALLDLLLRHGADLAARNDEGRTPRDVALEAEADGSRGAKDPPRVWSGEPERSGAPKFPTRSSYRPLTSPAGEVQSFTYAGSGLMQTATDAKGQVTGFTYDARGPLTGEHRRDNGQWIFDQAGTAPSTQVKETSAEGRALSPLSACLKTWTRCTSYAQSADPCSRRKFDRGAWRPACRACLTPQGRYVEVM